MRKQRGNHIVKRKKKIFLPDNKAMREILRDIAVIALIENANASIPCD